MLGEAVIETNVGVRSGIGGYIDTAPEIGAELVPLLFGSAAPSGTIADETYEYMRNELVSRLKDNLPVDAVALCLHGAGVAESYPDIEGDIGRAIREVVGPDVPLVSTWDLHGNISKECAATFDFMCCYQCVQPRLPIVMTESLFCSSGADVLAHFLIPSSCWRAFIIMTACTARLSQYVPTRRRLRACARGHAVDTTPGDRLASSHILRACPNTSTPHNVLHDGRLPSSRAAAVLPGDGETSRSSRLYRFSWLSVR